MFTYLNSGHNDFRMREFLSGHARFGILKSTQYVDTKVQERKQEIKHAKERSKHCLIYLQWAANYKEHMA